MQTGNFYLLQAFEGDETFNILLDYSTNQATYWTKSLTELEDSPAWYTLQTNLPTLDEIKDAHAFYLLIPLSTPSFKCSDYPELFV